MILELGRLRWPPRIRELVVTLGAAALLLSLGYSLTHSTSTRGPWRAAVFGNQDLSGQPLEITRHERLDFNWGDEAPLSTIPADHFSVRWETCFRTAEPLRVTFRLASDDGSRLMIDGQTLIDHWGRHPFTGKTRTTILAPGVHHLQVDYFEVTREARIRLMARPPMLAPTYLTYPPAPFESGDPCSDAMRP